MQLNQTSIMNINSINSINDFYISEWINKCKQFIKNHQNKLNLDEEKCLLMIWRGIISTKYLNLKLINICIDIFIMNNLTQHSLRRTCFDMSWNIVLTIDMLLAYPDLPWHWLAISRQMNINDILNHPELSWNWDDVSQNLSVTMEIVLSNIDKPWHWDGLSSHKNINMSDIESHIDLSWNWYYVNYNPNLTMTMIETYPDKEC